MYRIIFNGYDNGDSDNLIHTLNITILKENSLIFKTEINDLPKILKINNKIAVYADNMTGLGWLFGASLLDKIEGISSYSITIQENENFDIELQIICNVDEPPVIDGVFGDKKVELKNILNKYGLDTDLLTLNSLLEDIKKLKND